MKKFLQKKLKDQKGMTLIELLAVIVIIAIIAAIAIPAIGNLIENSRVGAIKSDALNALAAADLYYADNPDQAGPVTIATLENGYLDDAGSLTDAGTAPGITVDGEITASGNISGVTLTFAAANKEAINSVANNTADAGTNPSGSGTVTVDR